MLKWIFGADTSPFRRGLQQMRNETKAFSGSIKGMVAGALGLGAITAAFRGLFVEMDRVQKLGIRFGETAETIQKVDLAARLAGSGIETVARALTVATRNAYEAATGNKEYAESFDRLGINAAEFVNLSMEDKLTALAGAYERAGGSGEGLAQVMEVLGRSGGELIPLLSQGQEELQKQFAETTTASQSTVDSIAQFNDQITKLKQQAQVVGAAVINGLRLIFGGLGALLSFAVQNAMETLGVLVDGVKESANAIGSLLKGDLGGAAAAANRMKLSLKDAFDDAKSRATATKEVVEELFNEIFNAPSKVAAPGPDVEDVVAAAEEAKRIEEERAKLAAEVAAMEEEARKRQLTLAEKILEAEKERARLASEYVWEEDPTKSLEARKAILEVEKELEDLRAKQASEIEKTEGERLAKEQELADLLTREQEAQRANELAGMDDAGKLGRFRQERDALKADAERKLAAGDKAGAAESRIKATELQGQIEALQRSVADDLQSRLDAVNAQGPVIATSSLAEIGGGGGAALFGNETREQRKVELLAEIRDALRNQEGGAGTPIEPAG